MSSSRASLLQAAVAAYEQLKKELSAAKPNLAQCQAIFDKAKISLTQLTFLVAPGDAPLDPKELLLAREVLELGAQLSIRNKDADSFERTVTQLQAYYFDFKDTLPASQRMFPLLGLNLLRLLAQNRIAEFHTQLELFDAALLHSNIYIKHPVQLEQWIMEGRYNKVWTARGEVPAEEYLFFMDMLMETIRGEIACCQEKSYAALPIQDATSMLYFSNSNDLLAFAKERNWNVNVAEKKIYFNQQQTQSQLIPSEGLMTQFLGYARELERIV